MMPMAPSGRGGAPAECWRGRTRNGTPWNAARERCPPLGGRSRTLAPLSASRCTTASAATGSRRSPCSVPQKRRERVARPDSASRVTRTPYRVAPGVEPLLYVARCSRNVVGRNAPTLQARCCAEPWRSPIASTLPGRDADASAGRSAKPVARSRTFGAGACRNSAVRFGLPRSACRVATALGLKPRRPFSMMTVASTNSPRSRAARPAGSSGAWRTRPSAGRTHVSGSPAAWHLEKRVKVEPC